MRKFETLLLLSPELSAETREGILTALTGHPLRTAPPSVMPYNLPDPAVIYKYVRNSAVKQYVFQ